MIIGKHTKLRMFERDDIATYSACVNDLEETGDHWPAFIRSPRNLMAAFDRDGFSNDCGRTMLVTDLSDNWVGDVAVRTLSDEIAGQSVSYRVFKRENRGKGYMTEAVNLFCDWLFDVSPVERLTILTSTENAASRAVAENCGFQLEGTVRNGTFLRGRFHDLALYGRLRP